MLRSMIVEHVSVVVIGPGLLLCQQLYLYYGCIYLLIMIIVVTALQTCMGMFLYTDMVHVN